MTKTALFGTIPAIDISWRMQETVNWYLIPGRVTRRPSSTEDKCSLGSLKPEKENNRYSENLENKVG